MRETPTPDSAIKTPKEGSRTRTSEAGQTKTEISRGMAAFLSVVSGLIGAWTAACLLGGILASGGPLSFLKSWFSAVTGV